MKKSKKGLMIRICFFMSLILGLGLYYVSGSALQARQILKDVRHFQKLKERTPSIVQLRKHSATFRNLNGKCPCYKWLAENQFEITYSTHFGNIYIYSSIDQKWTQRSPK